MNKQTVWAGPGLRAKRADLSRLMEPGDLLGTVTVEALGPEQTHQLITGGGRATDQQQQAVGESAEAAGLSSRQRRLGVGLERWRTRLGQIGGLAGVEALHRSGGGFLVPEDAAWPQQLNDLYPSAPLGLWFRSIPGAADPYQAVSARLPRAGRSAALVGSREMSDYGGRVTWEMAAELARHGVTVVSGGAYGIDAAAHRGALAGGADSGPPKGTAPAPTLAVLAGGIDRLYPAGNERLLHAVLDSGLLLSEMAPGSAPTRHRFLQRNRIIAALAEVTVVVEARWRSGALSTAHHALGIGRPVGAVPGPVSSASSAGCHRLLRDTPAQLVTDAAEVMQLVSDEAAAVPGAATGDHPVEGRCDTDGLGQVDRLLYDALPVSRATTTGKLCEVAGLPVPEVLAGLTRLQRRGLVSGSTNQWKRSR